MTLDGRPTTRKTRVVAHNQQVVRADWESIAPLADRPTARASSHSCASAPPSSDAVILSDYAQGLVVARDRRSRAGVRRWSLADPKPQNVDVCSPASRASRRTRTKPAIAGKSRSSTTRRWKRPARELLEPLAMPVCRDDARRTRDGAVRARRRAPARAVGRAHGLRRQRRGRHGRRDADAGAGGRRADRAGRRGSRTSPPVRSSKNSAPRPLRRPRSSRSSNTMALDSRPQLLGCRERAAAWRERAAGRR